MHVHVCIFVTVLKGSDAQDLEHEENHTTCTGIVHVPS